MILVPEFIIESMDFPPSFKDDLYTTEKFTLLP